MSAPRAATVASLPTVCAVCAGTRRVRLLVPGNPPVHGGAAPCLHCSRRPSEDPIPIYVYPLRVDTPTCGGAA